MDVVKESRNEELFLGLVLVEVVGVVDGSKNVMAWAND